MQKAERIDWLDLAKCLAIFSMVWCHTVVPQRVDLLVHAFHMPIFFILSGWCFNLNKYSNFWKLLRSRFKALMIPYFFWGILLYALWQLFYAVTDPQKSIAFRVLLRSLFYDCSLSSPFAAVQWFLPCMFFAQLLAWGVLKCVKASLPATFCAVLLLAGLGWGLERLLPVRLPMAMDVAVSAAAFFLVGWLMQNGFSQKLRSKWKAVFLHPLIIPIELLAGIWLAKSNGYVNMRLILYNQPVLFYTAACLLSFGIIHGCYLVSRLLRQAKLQGRVYQTLVFLGQNTLLILMLNQVIIQSLKLLINDTSFYRMLSNHEQYLLWLVLSLAIMVVFIPIIHLIQHTLPFSVGKSGQKPLNKHKK